jgi:hypothetical protein
VPGKTELDFQGITVYIQVSGREWAAKEEEHMYE